MSKMNELSDNSRQSRIDVLRGVAILGVLMVNIHLFAGPESWHFNPTQREDLSWLDRVALLLTIGLLEGKFIALLSLLFGVGLALFSERYGQVAKAAHFKRMGLLGAIGLLHAYGFWHGDILVTYAITGALAWWVLPLTRRAQVRLIVVFFAIPSLFMVFAATSIPQWDEATLHELMAYRHPAAETIHAEIMGYQQGFWAQWAIRAPAAWSLQFEVLVSWTLWYTLSLMVLGMVLQRSGWLAKPKLGPLAWQGLSLGALGLSISACVALTRVSGQPDGLAWVFFYQPVVQQVGAFLLAFWYLLVVLSWSSEHGFVQRLAALGRWSLSVYLVQSLLCGALFYGHGLGWYGQRSPAEVLVLGVLISLLLVWWVPHWEARFGAGPAERLWRWAVRKPPVRAQKAI